MPRRFRRRPSRGAIAVVIVLAIAVVRLGLRSLSSPESPSADQFGEGRYQVVRVVDGDTLIVQPIATSSDRQTVAARRSGVSPRVRVRLLGIDTPETVHPDRDVEPWGPEATAFAERLVDKRQVRLQLDRRRIDRYGRLLAYVFVDDQLLNEQLVRRGLARVDVRPGDSQSFARRLRRAETEARDAHRGIWSTSPGSR